MAEVLEDPVEQDIVQAVVHESSHENFEVGVRHALLPASMEPPRVSPTCTSTPPEPAAPKPAMPRGLIAPPPGFAPLITINFFEKVFDNSPYSHRAPLKR